MDLEKFKGFKNQSLHIFDNESIIRDEVGADEMDERANVH